MWGIERGPSGRAREIGVNNEKGGGDCWRDSHEESVIYFHYEKAAETNYQDTTQLLKY